MKSSTPAWRAIASAVRGLSPVTITTLRPIRRSRANRSEIPGLRMSSSLITPTIRPPSEIPRGVAPPRGDGVDGLLVPLGDGPPLPLDEPGHGVGGALADPRAVG